MVMTYGQFESYSGVFERRRSCCRASPAKIWLEAISKSPSKSHWRRCSLLQNTHIRHVCCVFSSACALPLNLIWGFETASTKKRLHNHQKYNSLFFLHLLSNLSFLCASIIPYINRSTCSLSLHIS